MLGLTRFPQRELLAPPRKFLFYTSISYSPEMASLCAVSSTLRQVRSQEARLLRARAPTRHVHSPRHHTLGAASRNKLGLHEVMLSQVCISYLA